jgi:hypothetical protein
MTGSVPPLPYIISWCARGHIYFRIYKKVSGWSVLVKKKSYNLSDDVVPSALS